MFSIYEVIDHWMESLVYAHYWARDVDSRKQKTSLALKALV